MKTILGHCERVLDFMGGEVKGDRKEDVSKEIKLLLSARK